MLPARNTVTCFVLKFLRKASRLAAIPLTDPIGEDFVTEIPKTPPRVKISTLENGVRVASIDKGGSVSRLNISLQSGSRHERSVDLGISQLMKNAAFISNSERTSLRTVREMQQVGGSMQCLNAREAISRQAVFLRDKLFDVLNNLAPFYNAPLFNHWDLPDVIEFTRMENAGHSTNESAVNMELVHKTAFRDGLGNSLYCDESRIAQFTPESLLSFATENYCGERLVITGCDINHDELIGYTRMLFSNLPRGEQLRPNKQKYYGGETQVNTSNGFTYASLVAPGLSLSHVDLPSLLVLQRILGSGPYVKWGTNTVSSRLNKAASVVAKGPFMINSLNLSYSDSGLFGFHAIATADDIAPVLKAAMAQVSAVSQGEVNDADLQRAKNQAKASLLMVSENNEDLLDDLTKQVMLSEEYITPADAAAKIDDVSVAAVVQKAKALFGGKPTLAVNGNALRAPYLDELVAA